MGGTIFYNGKLSVKLIAPLDYIDRYIVLLTYIENVSAEAEINLSITGIL